MKKLLLMMMAAMMVCVVACEEDDAVGEAPEIESIELIPSSCHPGDIPAIGSALQARSPSHPFRP